MKKNLFLLFSFYFFVIQSVFIGLLWSEVKFYWLALVNCAFICLIAIFAKDSNQNADEKVQSKYDSENVMKKNEGMKINHFWIFLISFLFGILVVFWLRDVVLYLRFLVGIVGGIFVFIIGGLLFNYKSLHVREGKLYLILLVLSLLWSIVSLLNIDFSVFKFGTGEEISQNFEEETIGEEEIIGNGIFDLENSGDNLESIGENNLIQGEQLDNEIIGEEIDSSVEENTDDNTLATFADVIKFLLKDEILSTKTNLSFDYIGKSNPDYPYYMTAYEKKMIGKDLQPTKNLMCETFVVMKGLAEEWKVGSYTDIKQAYWNYAKVNDLLPDCQYGKYVTLGVINN